MSGEDGLVQTPYGYGRIVKHRGTDVHVKLDWGADAYLGPTCITGMITLQVKTFVRERRVLNFNWEVCERLNSLHEKLIKELELPTSAFLKILYPMGKLKTITPNDTPHSLGLTPNAQLVALVQQTFQWDEQSKGSNIVLSQNLKSATKQGEEDYETVLANICLDSGSHTWEIIIDRYIRHEDIFIGVAQKDLPLYTRPPETGQFWGYLCTNGKKFGPDIFMADYATSATTGDVIGVRLEFKEGQGMLSFSKNAEDFGTAFANVPGGVCPAVCLYYTDAQVSISYRV